MAVAAATVTAPFTRGSASRPIGGISCGAPALRSPDPARLADSAAVGHLAVRLLGGHDYDRQPELLHAVGKIPAQPA